MKSKVWFSLLTLLILLIGGCSTSKTADELSTKPMNKAHEGMDRTNGHMSHTNPLQLAPSTGENELVIPPLLEPDGDNPAHYSIVAQEGTTEFYQGVQTETYGYNGSFLGPVIRIQSGQTVQFSTTNEMSKETTFHWHGLEIPGEGDGGPHERIEPGQSKQLTFNIRQQAATLWFHPHPEGQTAEQVYKGLAGLIYVEDENSQRLGLPHEYGVNDIPLIFQDRQFDDQQQLNYQQFKNNDGTIGDTLLINGTLNPKLHVRQEPVRLRLVNGSNARNFTFKLSTNENFQQIATDGGFLNSPVPLNKLTLTPGERAEIIIDFSKLRTSNDLSLINEEGVVLLPFTITNERTTPQKMQDVFNQFSTTSEEQQLPVSKRIELFGMGTMVTINGKQFDKNRIDFVQQQGVTEIWEIYNKPDMMGGMTHPFHIHGTQFKIVSINGQAPPPNEQGWKDTVSIEPGESVKLAVKFQDKGIYMFHCHLLEHEDNGMMGQVKVE
ncbi:multicopper oxidase domain-containing protein [Lysinibacillus sphaericus]|uniref:multicopper oxidase family protein n=1 Tax=Lysinibacillus sphaericus TaxID=1421 RepID=UPI0018CC848F|nr:multicopper oxidase domain-containing protein [Lysinibacillus sphaericus]MBG9758179.1 multicopper oxidase [Lysinibacillus sphaericus]QTB15241.1 multicopper oxidase domain-containing protein [Lysinibacillus sphaericus]